MLWAPSRLDQPYHWLLGEQGGDAGLGRGAARPGEGGAEQVSAAGGRGGNGVEELCSGCAPPKARLQKGLEAALPSQGGEGSSLGGCDARLEG